MVLGLLLALASALATNVAFLFKHRGAVLAPPILVRHPLRSAVGLFRSRWFAIGWMVAILAWGLHVGALSLAPLSIVQAVLSGGLVFLAVFAERYFGFHLGRRQSVGVTITAAGLVVIALTGGGATHPQHASLAALIAVEGAIFATGAALVRISTRRHLPDRAEGLLLGAAAGALFGVSDVAIKWLTQAAPGPLLGALSPWTLTALVAGVISFYASARSLQIGEGVEVIALTSVAANLVAIIGGVLVFHEPIGSGAVAITGRFFAFCLVIAGAALMPAPMRATPARPNTPSGACLVTRARRAARRTRSPRTAARPQRSPGRGRSRGSRRRLRRDRDACGRR
jgi:drug/metabolite transporter (DMT)-like permease